AFTCSHMGAEPALSGCPATEVAGKLNEAGARPASPSVALEHAVPGNERTPFYGGVHMFPYGSRTSFVGLPGN
ncbi:MAG: hypothetical protein ACUVR3_05380, partial [Candidatus Roseilinea sp.]|uniref:hypothetical protein n=1 Tax=Candidatus Roseilinea sp. TaxID=2838777 RepID=UPI0040491791